MPGTKVPPASHPGHSTKEKIWDAVIVAFNLPGLVKVPGSKGPLDGVIPPAKLLFNGGKLALHSFEPEGRTLRERAAHAQRIDSDMADIGLGILALKVPLLSNLLALINIVDKGEKYIAPETYKAAEEKALALAMEALQRQDVKDALGEAQYALHRGGPHMAERLERIVENFQDRTGDPGQLLQEIREDIAKYGYTGGMSEEPGSGPPEASFEPPDQPNASFDRSAHDVRDNFLPPDEPNPSYGPNASYPPPDASFPPPPHDDGPDGTQPPLVAPDASR